MTKILVREHNASEELDQLEKFLNTEAQKIVVLDEENPAPATLAEDDLPEITWYLHKGGDVPAGIFSVVISDDGSGADGADKLYMKEGFSPSALLDEMRQRVEHPGPTPLIQLSDGYLTGDTTTLEYHTGVSPEQPLDAASVIDVWRARLGVKPKDDEADAGLDDEPGEDDKPAIPVIKAGLGW